MADLIEISNFEAGIYQFETTDPVEGGLNGIDNLPTRQLANRTRFLKDQALAHEAATNPHPQYITPQQAQLLNDSPAYRGVILTSVPIDLTMADANKLIVLIDGGGAGNLPVHLPARANVPTGTVFAFKNSSTIVYAFINPWNGDYIEGNNVAAAVNILPGQTFVFTAGDIDNNPLTHNANWLITGRADPLSALVAASSRVGTIFFHVGTTPPAGALAANGASYNPLTYPELHTVLQDPALNGLYGNPNDGYRVPDNRGMVAKGWDSRTLRALGSYEADDIKRHSHLTYGYPGPWTIPGAPITGHQYTDADYPKLTGDTGGAENLVRNKAYLACIWYI